MTRTDTGVQYTNVNLTPDDAKKLLATLDGRQRRIKPSHVEYLSRQILAGDWRSDTAEPIKVSQSGLLVDGQHRCAACVKADKPIQVTLATGIPDEIYLTLDTGLSRSPADQLRGLGVKNATDIAAVCRATDKLLKAWTKEPGNGYGRRLTSTELEDLLERYRDLIEESIELGVPKRVPSMFIKPLPVFRAVYVLAVEKAPEETRVFFDQLVTGENIKRGDPAYALRSWLMRRFSGDKKYGGGSAVAGLVTRVLISCLNAHLAGRPLSKVGPVKADAKLQTIKAPKAKVRPVRRRRTTVPTAGEVLKAGGAA